jgi:SnoaL-like domain
MNENPIVDIAARYFEALATKDLTAAPLALDVVLESPVTPRLEGLASVLEYLEALTSIAKTIRVLDFIADGNKVAVQFEIVTATGIIPAFERIEISNGLIRQLRPYFESRPFVNGGEAEGGRTTD